MAFLKVDINPEVIRWARESIGENVAHVANILKIETNLITTWESNGREIPLGKLEQLARIYKRSLAVFFLFEKYEEAKPLKDFRTLPKNQKVPFSRETRLAIRRAQRLQLLASDLAAKIEEKRQMIIPKLIPQEPWNLARKIRDYLGISFEQQSGWKDDRIALTKWINALEKTGILVFQMSMPIEEVRGFSLESEDYPVIVLNIKDSVRARIFSLFHEYCHILRKNAGICDLGDEKYISGKVKFTETYCNYFAGAFLVPEKYLLAHPLVKIILGQNGDFNRIIRQISTNFRVSREVILRRLLILGKISPNFYESKIKEFKEEFKQIKTRSKGGWLVPYRKCFQEKGNSFISMVFEAKRLGKITTRDISDYLGVRRKHLLKLERVIKERF